MQKGLIFKKIKQKIGFFQKKLFSSHLKLFFYEFVAVSLRPFYLEPPLEISI